MPIHLLHESHTLLVEGPCSLRIVEGRVECFGAEIMPSMHIEIKEPRQLAFFAIETTLFEVNLRGGGNFREIEQSTIPTSWIEAAQIIQQSSKVSVIIGDVDSGKSTLCTFLANKLFKQNVKVAVIDADIGQADVGPPATVAAATINKPIMGLQELQPEHSFFIGDTSPSSVPEKLIENVLRLKEKMADSADTILVNTDGWVREPLAIHFKTEFLARAKPDLVVGLASADEMDPLLRLASFISLKLDRSAHAKTRTKAERKKARETGYRRFLRGSHLAKYDSDRVQVRLFNDAKQTLFTDTIHYGGLLTGLLDSGGEMKAVGRLVRVLAGTIIVETRMIERPDILELGVVQLSAKYEETGYGLLH